MIEKLGRRFGRFKRVRFRPAFLVSGESVEEAFLAIVLLAAHVPQHVGHVPGGVSQRVVFLPEAIRLSRPGVRHIVAAEEIGGILVLDLGISLGPAVDLISLAESEEIVVNIKAGKFIDRFLVIHLELFHQSALLTATQILLYVGPPTTFGCQTAVHTGKTAAYAGSVESLQYLGIVRTC